MDKFLNVFKQCRETGSNFATVLFKTFMYKLHGKNIIADGRTVIKGIKNLSTNGTLKIAIQHADFTYNKDYTILDVRGKLDVNGNFSLGRGSRLQIHPTGKVILGDGSYINGDSRINISNRLLIGNNTYVAWGCQFIDLDYHELSFEGKKITKSSEIIVSDNVWIGCNVSVYKGTYLAKGCVVAAESTVRGIFNEENCLIAGNPAVVIKRNISWK